MKFVSVALLFPAVLWPAVWFEPNMGQSRTDASFVARAPRGVVAVRARGIQLSNGAEVVLEGARANARLDGDDRLPGVSHYARDRDPANWVYDVPHFAALLAREVWKGIDVRYHEHRGTVEFDFNIKPHASVDRVRLRFSTDVSVSPDGGLRAKGITLRAPVAWQEDAKGRRVVAVRFAAAGKREVRLVAGQYDSNLALIVDPIVEFATYLGGASEESATEAVVDSSGAIYVAGTTYSTDFPASLPEGSMLNVPASVWNSEVYVTRLTADASKQEWSIFIGGGALEKCGGLAADSLGNIYVYGSTTSPDFPVTAGAWRTSINPLGRDHFVARLDAASGRLKAATFLQMPSNDQYYGSDPYAVSGPFTVDSGGGVYVASSNPGSLFQPTPGAYDTGKAAGFTEAGVIRLNAGLNSLVYATYLDTGRPSVLLADASGNLWVGGKADQGGTFPSLKPIAGVAQTGGKLYLAKLNPRGTAVLHASLLHERSFVFDDVTSLSLNADGNVYVAGAAVSFPQVAPLNLETAPGPASGFDQTVPFVALVAADGSRYLQSTHLQGGEFVSAADFSNTWPKLARPNGRLCLTGLGGGAFSPTAGGIMPASEDYGGQQTLACADMANTRFEIKTRLPKGRYRSVSATPDGALVFAGVSSGGLETGPLATAAQRGVVQPEFGGSGSEIAWQTQAWPNLAATDAFLMRVGLTNSVPHIDAVFPDSVKFRGVIYGQPSGLAVRGSGFSEGMQVTLNGKLVKPQYPTPTSFLIPAPFEIVRGRNELVISVTGTGGGVSNTAVITGVSAGPSPMGIFPASVAAGSAEVKVVISGTNLSSESKLIWGGAVRQAVYNSGRLEILLAAAELTQPATIPVSVVNPGPGGGTATDTFIVQPAGSTRAPAVGSMAATSSGTPITSIVVTGSGFEAGTTAYWDGIPVSTSLVSSSQLRLTFSDPDQSRLGTHEVYAVNGGLKSGKARVYMGRGIFQGRLAVLKTYEPVLGRVYAVMFADSAAAPAELNTYDATDGATVARVAALPSAKILKASRDGKYVYVAGGVSGMEIVRFNATTLSVDLSWRVSLPEFVTSGEIAAIVPLPENTESIAVVMNYQRATPHLQNGVYANAFTDVAIFDREQRRLQTAHGLGLDTQPIGGVPAWATPTRLNFRVADATSRVCWIWMEYDVFGIREGSSRCAEEPAEVIHEPGATYIRAGTGSAALSVLGVTGGIGNSIAVDGSGRTAYLGEGLSPFRVTRVNLDSLEQNQITFPLASPQNTTNVDLFTTPRGVLVLRTDSFYLVQY